MADAGVGLPHRQVDVAVAGVTAPDHQRARRPGQPAHRVEVGGDGGTRHHHVHQVVGPVGLRRPEGTLAGLDQLGAGLVRQHVDVERAEAGHPFGQ